MLVKDLIRRLQQEDQNATVMFCYDYGDHHHTIVVEGIRKVEVVDLRKSGYGPSGLAVLRDGDGYTPEPDVEDVVVLA